MQRNLQNKPTMNIQTQVEFERENETFTVDVEGEVTRHYGHLEVSGLTSSRELTADEQTVAEEQILEAACHYGPIPEMEPDYLQKDWR